MFVTLADDGKTILCAPENLDGTPDMDSLCEMDMISAEDSTIAAAKAALGLV
jgi:hypothetical protein